MNKNNLEQQINNNDGQMGIIFNIPTNTVRLKVIATIIDEDNNLHEATRIAELPEIFDARIFGNEWELENVHYELTDKGRELLNGK